METPSSISTVLLILLYGLLTLKWAIVTDFTQLKRYQKMNLKYANSKGHSMQWVGLIISKIIYFSVWLLMPILFYNIVWWKVLIGFFVMHYTASLILSLVFQLAHVIGEADMPLPDLKTGIMKNSWVVHQNENHCKLFTKNRIVNWFTGGLNHQIEHHIFSKYFHIHYSKISAIVKKTAREFNLPHNEYKTTRAAIISHFRFLKKDGYATCLRLINKTIFQCYLIESRACLPQPL